MSDESESDASQDDLLDLDDYSALSNRTGGRSTDAGGSFDDAGYQGDDDDRRNQDALITSVGAAVTFVESLFETQLERAETERTAPNEPVNGDGRARSAFLALLPREEQRRLFLWIASRNRYWPRIRTLIGAPPFPFLRDEDEGMLRAAGIANRRSKLSQETTISNYSHIGQGHFQDRFERTYLVVARRGANAAMSGQHGLGIAPAVGSASSEPLMFAEIESGSMLAIDMKIRKMSRKVRYAIARRANREELNTIRFPYSGEKLELSLNRRLKTQTTARSRLLCVVKRVVVRDAQSVCARILVAVE